MRQDDIRRLVNKLAIFADTLRGHQVKGNPQMNATLAEVTVHRRLVLILFEQTIELTKIATELLRRYGGILPAFPPMLLTGNENRSAQARFADMPYPLGLDFGV